jgi:hypothetical protein
MSKIEFSKQEKEIIIGKTQLTLQKNLTITVFITKRAANSSYSS